MKIETERLILREFTVDDFDILCICYFAYRVGKEKPAGEESV